MRFVKVDVQFAWICLLEEILVFDRLNYESAFMTGALV